RIANRLDHTVVQTRHRSLARELVEVKADELPRSFVVYAPKEPVERAYCRKDSSIRAYVIVSPSHGDHRQLSENEPRMDVSDHRGRLGHLDLAKNTSTKRHLK